MALHQLKFATAVLEEHFGPVIASICEELKWGPKPLKLLSSNVKLKLAVVKQALSIMIHFNFVEYKIPEGGSNCEYSVLPENILMLTRYSRFIFMIGKKFGKEAEFIIQELLYSGKMTLYNLIIKVTYSLSQVHSEIPYGLTVIKNAVCDLIVAGFIMPVQRVIDNVVPIPIALTAADQVPNIDMQKLSGLYHGTDTEFPKKELYWRINFNRFLIEFRDDLLQKAMTERVDAQAGIVVRHLLKLSFTKTDLWRSESNPIPVMLVRDSITGDTNATDALKYTEQYIRVMEEDSGQFISRSSEHTGAVIFRFKDVIERLTNQCMSQIVDQKLGSKAARVFRLVQDKKYIEIEQIQRLAMLADKEAKQITYKLLEENFLQMQELRKPTTNANASGPNKSFFLFYVDINVLIPMVMGMCYKAMYNLLLKCREEQQKHSHIVEKKKHADLIIEALKERNATEEQISDIIKAWISPPEKMLLDSLQRVTKKLHLGISQIDDTILLLQLYMQCIKKPASNVKPKKK